MGQLREISLPPFYFDVHIGGSKKEVKNQVQNWTNFVILEAIFQPSKTDPWGRMAKMALRGLFFHSDLGSKIMKFLCKIMKIAILDTPEMKIRDTTFEVAYGPVSGPPKS